MKRRIFLEYGKRGAWFGILRSFLKIPFRARHSSGALLLAVLILSFLFQTSLFAAELQNISWETAPASTRVILKWDGPVALSQHRLPATKLSPQRYYVDAKSSSPSARLPRSIRVEDGRLNKIRLGLHNANMRVVFDVEPDQKCQISLTSVTDGMIAEVTIASSSAPQSVSEPSLPASVGETAKQESPNEIPLAELAPQAALVWSQPQETTCQVTMWAELFGYSAKDMTDDDYDDDTLSRLQARVGGSLERELSSAYVLETRVQLEGDRLYYDAGEADEDTEVDLYEASLALSAPTWDLSVGKQRIRWGKSDQLSPLDSLNPEDLRQFMTLDLEERKEPSWLARVRKFGESFTLEAIISPWFEESELDYFDSDWALYRNLRQTILAHPDIPPSLKSYASALRVHERKPSNSLENMSGSVRLLWQTNQADFALSYRYGWETLPTIISFPVKNIDYNGDPETDPTALLTTAVLTDEAVEARYKRQKIVGLEWETVIDLIGFRGEVAYIDKIAFLSSDLTSKRRDVGHLVTGIDYTSETEWYFNLQGSWLRIFNYDRDLLYFEQDNVALLGEIRKPVWRGNLEFAIRYNYTLTDNSSYLQPSVVLKYFPNTTCEIGANFFSGQGETLFGSYDQADQVYVRLNVSL